jgi:hypothetical protein
MNQDAPPSMTQTRREHADDAGSQARSALDAPPDNEFDALTDLFIGDGVLSPHGSSESGAASTMLRIVPEHVPQAVAREPMPSESMARESVSPERTGGSLASEAGRAHVTALVLGHLPVFASAWANQYARHLAQDSGAPVAVIRIRGGYAAVDVVGADQTDIEPAQSIEHAICQAASVTNRWVLRVGEPDEPTLSRCDAIDELTLLTGIDEAAVVASYQTLKRFAREDENSPEITLAVMAASDEQAQPIAHKISRAAETFLERPARVICCIEKISGGPSAHVFGGDSTITLDEALDLIREPREAISDAAPVEQAETADALESIVEPSPALTAVDRMLSELIEGHDDDREAAPLPHRDVPRAFPDETPAQACDSSAGAASGPACAEVPTCELDGFETLEAKCPYCESILLAIDAHGSLHLIADADATIENQLVGLTTAAGWAADHMRLLALAEPDLDAASYPTRHLITRTPAAVRRLLDSDLRVHLLVDGPGDTHTVIPLNYA